MPASTSGRLRISDLIRADAQVTCGPNSNELRAVRGGLRSGRVREMDNSVPSTLHKVWLPVRLENRVLEEVIAGPGEGSGPRGVS